MATPASICSRYKPPPVTANPCHTHAQAYSEHAGKPGGTIEIDDVMLSIQSRTAYTFVQPPSLEMVTDLAKRVNGKEMPKFPAHKPGLLLPEDKECLTSQNYRYLPPQ